MARRILQALWIAAFAMSCVAARAQSVDVLIKKVVDTERSANASDHSKWIYLDDVRRSREHTLQWVAETQQGDVRRVIRREDQSVAEPEQREGIDRFLHDGKAQRKQIAENDHDRQQVDDLLKLLPEAFRWTETGATAETATLHFEPDPGFRPPTREARVFSGMAGDVVVDKADHRIRSMTGHLMHDVTFGGGLLGRLREGSSFSLEQARVGQSVWELTAIHVHLQGNALLFKSISLEQDDLRSKFEPEAATVTLDEAAKAVMVRGEEVSRVR